MELYRGVADPAHKFIKAVAESTYGQAQHAELQKECEKEVRMSMNLTR